MTQIFSRPRIHYPFVVNAVLSLAAGCALWLGTAPMHMWVAPLVGVLLLWIVVYTQSIPRAFWWGFVAGFVYFFLLMDWAQAATASVAPRIVLAIIEAAFVGILGTLWAGLWRVAARHRSAVLSMIVVLLSAAAWVGLEELRSAWPYGGLPWGLLAFSLLDSPFMSLAPFGSTQLVALAAVVSVLLAGVTLIRLAHLRMLLALRSALTAALILLGLTLLAPPSVQSEGSLRLGVVQGNADYFTLTRDEEWNLRVTQNHRQATQSVLAQNPELIVWPESSSERDIREDSRAGQIVAHSLVDSGLPLVMGTQDYFKDSLGRDVRTNDYLSFSAQKGLSAAQVNLRDAIVDKYSKQHPVPFGEYVPSRDFYRSLTPLVDLVGTDMVPGSGKAQLQVRLNDGRAIRLAVPICFEVAYSGIVADGVLGSQLIIVPTSNVTFGRSHEAVQQFDMTRFRAIEHGRVAVQVSTNGVSGIALADGSVLYETKLWEQDARVTEVPLASGHTFASSTARQRTWLAFLSLGVAALAAFSGVLPVALRGTSESTLRQLGV